MIVCLFFSHLHGTPKMRTAIIWYLFYDSLIHRAHHFVPPPPSPSTTGRWEVPDRSFCTANRRGHRRWQKTWTGIAEIGSKPNQSFLNVCLFVVVFFDGAFSLSRWTSWRNSARSHKHYNLKTEMPSSRLCQIWGFSPRWRSYWWAETLERRFGLCAAIPNHNRDFIRCFCWANARSRRTCSCFLAANWKNLRQLFLFCFVFFST